MSSALTRDWEYTERNLASKTSLEVKKLDNSEPTESFYFGFGPNLLPFCGFWRFLEVMFGF